MKVNSPSFAREFARLDVLVTETREVYILAIPVRKSLTAAAAPDFRVQTRK